MAIAVYEQPITTVAFGGKILNYASELKNGV